MNQFGHKQVVLVVIILGLVVAATVLLLGNKSDIQSSSSGEKQIISLGAAVPLTGKASSYGERIRNGLDLAVEEINAQQTRFELKVLHEDTKSETAAAVNAAKKLVEVDGVPILFVVRSNDVLAIAPFTEQKKVVLFTPLAGSDDISSAGDFVFRNRETASLHGTKMAEFLFEKGFRRIALVRAESANSVSYANSFSRRFQELGAAIVSSETYQEDEKDFRTILLRLLREEPQAVYVAPATEKDGGLLVKQLAELGENIRIASAVTIEGPDFLKTAGNAAEGVWITSPGLNLNNPVVKEFLALHQQRFGTEGDFVSANAYDAMQILFQAFSVCEGTNPACVRDTLYRTKDYLGVGGKTTFDKNGDVVKPLMLKVVQNGKFIPLE